MLIDQMPSSRMTGRPYPKNHQVIWHQMICHRSAHKNKGNATDVQNGVVINK